MSIAFAEAGLAAHPRYLHRLVDLLGSAEGIVLIGGVGRDREQELHELIARYA
ncbi:MAG: hypothetical protein RBU25_21080 [Lentisphaeria bacterium]|jgi:hypothetical protein|nr:hypothetical protein [Lentisphaeria bacterium]